MAYTQVGLNNTLKKLFHYLVPLLLVTSALHLKASADTLSEFDALARAGYVYADSNGRVLEGIGIDEPLIPASTTKLVTAWLALTYWGLSLIHI